MSLSRARPLVSVVVPSYDHARFVEAALRSVETQTWRPLELVVVDDGSTDGSPALLRSLVPRLRLDRSRLVEQENRGAHEAIMRGIRESKGEWIAILNSDDAYHPRRLETLVPRLLRGDGQLAFSGVRFVDAAGEPLPPEHAWPAWYRGCFEGTAHCPTVGFALLAHNFSVTSGNFVFARALAERVGGFSPHRFCHDWDFLIRTIHHAEPLFERTPLLDYRVHDANTTETVRDLLRDEASDALRRYIHLTADAIPPNPLAPCPSNWPHHFEALASRIRLPFAPDTTLASFWSAGG